MSGTMPYIGSKISLITMSELRYEGILVNVNTVNSTVTLRDVRMFGTENRAAQSFVMPSAEVFDYIVFNGKDIKDLTVCEPNPMPLKEDPAVVSVNVPPSQGPGSNGYTMNNNNRQRGVFGMNNNNYDNSSNRNMSYNRNNDNDMYNSRKNYNNNNNMNMGGRPQYNNRNNMNHMNQNMQQGMNGRMGMQTRMGGRQTGYGMAGGRIPGSYNGGYNSNNRMSSRGGRGGIVGELHAQPNSSLTTQVAEAFDFQEQNDKFDKSNLPAEAGSSERPVNAVKYDKTSSFFDHISCETLDKQEGRSSRVDRSEQRKVDQETFGVAAAMARGPRYFKRGYRRGGPAGMSGMRGGPRREQY